MINIAAFAKLHNLNSKQRKDCILINEVKRYTFLYDRNEMNHKRSRYRRAAWEEIGQKLGMDGIDCMNRWKVIRDRYRREKRHKVRGPMSVRNRRWIYHDLCTFLDPFLEDVKPFSQELDEVMNAEENYSAEDSSQDSSRMQEDKSDEKNSSTENPSMSFNVPSTSSLDASSSSVQPTATISVAPLNAMNPTVVPPNSIIRIVMPTEPLPPATKTRRKPGPKSRTKNISTTRTSSPRKYVKILPKTEMPSPPSKSSDKWPDEEDGVDLSAYKDNKEMDTVDHLMNFMGNTLKQLPFKRQVKICQELTAVFFNIITTEEEEDD